MSPAEKLLSRLTKVRQRGPRQWSACCPSHDSKSSASLSIKECDDGRLLLHDFGGCSVETVLGAVGLQVKDLFVDAPRAPGAGTPAAKLKLPASQALEILSRESLLVFVVGSDMHKKRSITDTDFGRLAVAVRRVQQIAEATR